MYCWPITVRVKKIKEVEIGWACGARGYEERKNIIQCYDGETPKKNYFDRAKRRWEYNIKT